MTFLDLTLIKVVDVTDAFMTQHTSLVWISIKKNIKVPFDATDNEWEGTLFSLVWC